MNIILNQFLNNAFAEAEITNCKIVTVEHLLLAITEDYYVIDFFNKHNLDIYEITELTTKYLNEYIAEKSDTPTDKIHGSIYLFKVLENLKGKITDNTTIPVSLIILKEIILLEESWASMLLSNYGINENLIDMYIEERDKTQKANVENKPKKEFIDDFVVDLVEMAKKGKFDPLIGRTYEIDRAIQILSRRNKNNVIFIGEAGVGKSAIVNGIANKIANNEIEDNLKDSSLLYLDISSIVAGTKYRGEFEKKLKKVLNTIEKMNKPIIFIDEIHTIVKSGATEGNAMDTANILKPYLLKGSFKCIGATTYEEYKKYIEKDKALSRRFQKIEVEEPTISEAKKILKNLIYYYETYHSVKYTESAVDKAVELSHQYIKDRFLPDKALDIIDEAGAYVKLKEEEKIVKEKHIKKIVSNICRIKIEETKKDEISSLSNLANNLKKEIFGQDEAIEKVVQIIKTSKAGLTENTKPIGSFLFCGPTGVGKTELAKRIAHHMEMNFLRFDMSEYMEKHAVAKLIGSPPGYVGFDEGGQLIEQIKRNPYSVLLLDEIEKAHSDIYNVLLQVMDYATLTDNAGRKADFRNCIIIMTTNAGAREINSNNIGFLEKAEDNKNTQNAVKSVFSPEFRNRLDYIITFNKLDSKEIKKIVRKFIGELNTMLTEKGVRVRITDRASEYLAEKGFDKTMGARPIKRLINEEIKVKLSDEILFGKLKNGGSVLIDYDEKIYFIIDER